MQNISWKKFKFLCTGIFLIAIFISIFPVNIFCDTADEAVSLPIKKEWSGGQYEVNKSNFEESIYTVIITSIIVIGVIIFAVVKTITSKKQL